MLKMVNAGNLLNGLTNFMVTMSAMLALQAEFSKFQSSLAL